MELFHESSLPELYASAIDAFPSTRKRQHAVDPVRVARLKWTPFLGMKTLLVRGEIQSEGSEYATTILLRSVDYTKNEATLLADDGLRYEFGLIDPQVADVNVRCNCPDFQWRFNHYNSLDSSLYGRGRTKYEGSLWKANPKEMPGLCKHLMKTVKAIDETGIFG